MPGYERIEASAPGRVCLAGESLNWMINGPSVVGAITLRAAATVQHLPTVENERLLYIQSTSPFSVSSLQPWRSSVISTDEYLRFVRAAVRSFEKYIDNPPSLSVIVDSAIPVNAGVSSSAAVTLATTAATAAFFGFEPSAADLCEMAYAVEHDDLDTGAGRMDPYACGMGDLLYLNCGTNPVTVERHVFPETLGIVLVDTLTPHKTRSFISSKRKRFMEGDADIYRYVDETERMVDRLHQLMPDFNNTKGEVGDIMTRLHGLLKDKVRCSTDLLDSCVETAVQNGALGAKLTGSGNGGCMFALVDREHEDQVSNALKKLPVRIYETTIVSEGVSVQREPMVNAAGSWLIDG